MKRVLEYIPENCYEYYIYRCPYCNYKYDFVKENGGLCKKYKCVSCKKSFFTSVIFKKINLNQTIMKSKTQQIKRHLERYKKITSWTAIEKYRATRLSSIIFELKNRYGMNIKTEMVYENKTNYGVYRLIK